MTICERVRTTDASRCNSMITPLEVLRISRAHADDAVRVAGDRPRLDDLGQLGTTNRATASRAMPGA